MSLNRSTGVALLVLSFIYPLSCVAAEPTWSVDETTGCKVWNSSPLPNETVSYTGPCVDGIANGHGILQWYQDGRPGGRGEGEYRNGRLYKGTQKYRNGDVFQGSFDDTGRSGKGVYTWPNGSRYEGEWANDKRNGFGVMSLVEGDPGLSSYNKKGAWEEGRLVIRGLWADGNIKRECRSASACQPSGTSGWFVDDISGCKVWNNSSSPEEDVRYSGACPNGIAEGKGTAQWYKNGQPSERAEGVFRNGRLEGKTVYTWSNGERYEGNYSDNKRAGKGVYTWPNGSRYEGEWSDGKRDGYGVLSLARGDGGIASYGSRGTWQGNLFIIRGMWSGGQMQRECASEKECQTLAAAERERERQEEARRHRCGHLYTGKVVKAPTKSWLFGSGNEQAIVLGFSASDGVATVRSTQNSNMVGEVPCWSLQ